MPDIEIGFPRQSYFTAAEIEVSGIGELCSGIQKNPRAIRKRDLCLIVGARTYHGHL